jgi:predicted N-acyltransferase
MLHFLSVSQNKLALNSSVQIPFVPVKEKKIIAQTGSVFCSGYELVLVETAASINVSDWNACVPMDNFFLSIDFLSAFEKIGNSALSFRYVILYGQNKKPAAAFYFQIIHIPSDDISSILEPVSDVTSTKGILSHWTEWLKRSKEEQGFRLLISGNNFISGEHGIGIATDENAPDIYKAFTESVKFITKNDLRPAKISAVLVKDFFVNEKKQDSDLLRRKRYHRFLVEPEMIVDLQASWNSFEEYLAAMSKKYRNRAKTVMKKSALLEEVELTADDVEKCKSEIHELYLNLHERARFKLAALSVDYFPQMKKRFPEIFRITGYRLNGKWVAFRSSFLLSNHLEAHFIGINYELNQEYNLYQRILYDYVNEGIQSRKPQVFLGRTAAEIKSTVGAVAHDLVCYIRHRNSFSNQIIRPFIDYLKPSVWIPRNPFKDEA